MDLAAYFARIGREIPTTPSLATLQAIAAAHPQAITFENLAVTAGGVPEITPQAAFAKLVTAGRGGYCYEHNTLLQAVLNQLGYTTTPLSARVRFNLPADYVDARGHMILKVDLPEGPYLIDTGFGGLTLTGAIPLRLDTPTPTPHETLRLIDVNGDYRLQADLNGSWADVYQFDLSPQLPPDIVSQNWYTATRPNALFRHNLIVTRPVPGGRYTLFNQTLTWRPLAGPPERRTIAGAAALAEVLRETFALTIPPAEIAAAAEVAAKARKDATF